MSLIILKIQRPIKILVINNIKVLKTFQSYLSALIDLFFPRFDPKNPEVEIPPRPWFELIGISILLIVIIALMVLT